MDDLFFYRFEENFERKLLRVLCSPFGDRLITTLVEDSFERPATKWFVKACLAVLKDTGKAPRSVDLVFAKFSFYHEKAGTLSLQQLLELQIFCKTIEAEEIEDEEQVVLTASTNIKAVEKARIADEVDTMASEGRDFAPITAKIENLERIGLTQLSTVTNTEDHLEEMLSDLEGDEELQEVLPTGISEIDSALGGGLLRGDLACYLGNTGDGKSRFLGGHCNVALGMGLDVFWASNELQRQKQFILWLAASLKMDSTKLQKNSALKKIAYKRIMALHKQEQDMLVPSLRRGTWAYSYFEPDVATIEDVFDAFLRERDRRKKEIPVLCLDYLKRLKYPDNVEGDYKGVGVLGVKARAFAQKENIFFITAHQAKRRKDDEHIYDKNDCADSHNLPRELDFLLTLNPLKGQRNIHTLNAAKLRDAPPMESFVIETSLGYGCGHINQVGWRPDASLPSYLSNIYKDIEFGM
jgi:archaellum biogenesis ATPase FlaH